MPFPFKHLPCELAHEIIRFTITSTTAQSGPEYSTIVALCSVSYKMRAVATPHLLDTVVLSSDRQLQDFCASVTLQSSRLQESSRLYLDYTALVRRFWSTESWDPLVHGGPDSPTPDYVVLSNIMRNVVSLGLNFRSLQLLYNGICRVKTAVPWACTRLTLAGDWWRWRPVTSTPQGLEYLARLTHLILWIPEGRIIGAEAAYPPQWLKDIPFEHMHGLTHIAFPLVFNSGQTRNDPKATTMLVYSQPIAGRARDFKKWALSADAASYGSLVEIPDIERGVSQTKEWEAAFWNGKSESVWSQATKAQNKMDCSR